MSDGATGPWVHKGKIMQPNIASTGNHPGIIDYKGRTYLFGFNYELNFAMTPIHHERRSVTVTNFAYNPDGTIPEQPWSDEQGVARSSRSTPIAGWRRRRSRGHRKSRAIATARRSGRRGSAPSGTRAAACA
ncbi:hypothetical protein AB5I41_27735 [Sphingomonas sp. MMS24-JH45]